MTKIPRINCMKSCQVLKHEALNDMAYYLWKYKTFTNPSSNLSC